MKIKKTKDIKINKKKTVDNNLISTQWTIRGISLEARNAAQKAAQKNNEFIGSWISRKLLEAAQIDLTTKQELVNPETMHDILDKMQSNFFEEFNKINSKIESLSNRRSFLSKLMRKFSNQTN